MKRQETSRFVTAFPSIGCPDQASPPLAGGRGEYSLQTSSVIFIFAEDPMKPETKRVAKAVGAAVAGATVGYMAGVLTAPSSGAETRKRIGRKVEEKVEDITLKTKRTMKDAREKVASAMHH